MGSADNHRLYLALLDHFRDIGVSGNIILGGELLGSLLVTTVDGHKI
jgi:hypothetical protein